MTMLDKIAEAIEAAVADAGIHQFEGSAAARAALTAMMEGEPPKYLETEMDSASDHNNVSYFGRDYVAAFRAGIQAILNEGAEK